MPITVLAGPGESNFTSDGYARTYNLLSRLPDGVTVDAVVGNIEETVNCADVTLHEVSHKRLIRYKVGAYSAIAEKLRSETYDIYHHVNMNALNYDPVLLGEIAEDTSVILGPAERGHDVPPDALKIFVDALLGTDLSLSTASVLHEVVQLLRLPLDVARKALFERTLQYADRLVAVNEETKHYYEKFVPESRIEVIPHGVDLNHYQYSPRSDELELLTVGRLISRKGIGDLLVAMQEVVEKFPTAHLRIVGDGPLRNDLERRAADLNVEESVTFHGRVPETDLLRHYREARAFVHPSHSEGFPHVRLEAMASGCPVIGTDVTGARELTRNSIEGLVVPVNQPDHLAEAMISLLKDKSLASEMGRNARERVEERHDWSDIADQYATLYREVLDGS